MHKKESCFCERWVLCWILAYIMKSECWSIGTCSFHKCKDELQHISTEENRFMRGHFNLNIQNKLQERPFKKEKKSKSLKTSLLVKKPFRSCQETSFLLNWLKAGIKQFTVNWNGKKRILSRKVPDDPEWSGSGNKFTQRHLCHFRGTMLSCFNQVKS